MILAVWVETMMIGTAMTTKLVYILAAGMMLVKSNQIDTFQ